MSATDSLPLFAPIPHLSVDDRKALHRQLTVIEQRLQDGEWHTLEDLAKASGATEAGASARVRDCRRLGWNVVRVRGAGRLWLYRIDGRRPVEPAQPKPRDSRLDALERRIAEIEERLARGREVGT